MKRGQHEMEEGKGAFFEGSYNLRYPRYDSEAEHSHPRKIITGPAAFAISPNPRLSMNSEKWRLVEIMRFSNDYFTGLPGDAKALSPPDKDLWLSPQ